MVGRFQRAGSAPRDAGNSRTLSLTFSRGQNGHPAADFFVGQAHGAGKSSAPGAEPRGPEWAVSIVMR